ncbi:hypothetical protein XarCFBP6762_14300 [Xanthomonas arboricola]|nr:hypothetical protein XarCFBP6762_14300 [Xanthomonas arboricola]
MIPSPNGRRWPEGPDEGALRPTSTRLPWQTRRHAPVRLTRKLAADAWLYFPPRPGPRLRRGRSQSRAPMARKLCLLAPTGEGL